MADKYDVIFLKYKEYIESNSKYSAKVIKYNKKSSTYFPIISFYQSDNEELNRSTYSIDNFEKYYFTINIYTKNKQESGALIPQEVIDEELEKLTLDFFNKLNFKKTLNQPTQNIDDSILRRTIRYQCEIDNRNNIIRR